MFDLLRKHIEKFTSLTDTDWLLLLPQLKIKKLRKNAFFSKEGKICREIGFILQGNMRHFYSRDGEEKTTYFYFENHFVTDYISCISGKPGLISIEALSDCELIVFPYTVLQQLYSQSHAWERFGRLIAEYLAAGLEERMTGLLMLSPEERYLQLLDSNKQKILERIPQHLIANYLGITPVSLSRIRNRMLKK
ncbi:MAG: Crp/Fnr family transcriptional regulator [Bacteroidota bacterium]|nr:Crp/Fnr family transcriptional regulator [Bacteroidota bacterium]